MALSWRAYRTTKPSSCTFTGDIDIDMFFFYFESVPNRRKDDIDRGFEPVTNVIGATFELYFSRFIISGSISKEIENYNLRKQASL